MSKHALKCRFYVRYVDDFVLVSESQEQLLEWRDAIETFLDRKLSLSLKNPGILRRVSDGADFLGYIVMAALHFVAAAVVNNLKAKLALYRCDLVSRGEAGGKASSDLSCRRTK